MVAWRTSSGFWLVGELEQHEKSSVKKIGECSGVGWGGGGEKEGVGRGGG